MDLILLKKLKNQLILINIDLMAILQKLQKELLKLYHF